jgi:hypothetical protein
MNSSDAVLILAAFALVSSAFDEEVAAAEPSQVPPPFKQLRYDEDYGYLHDLPRRTDLFDPIKYIPLTESGASYLTLGGEIRERYEYFRNPIWGAAPQDNDGYWLQRYMLHADAHFGDSLRAFVQLKSGLETGRRGGPRPTDRDEADLHQAFFDVRVALADTNAFTLRLGRQELAYGSSRLISFRESPNVRLSFDGAKAFWQMGQTRIDAFALKPVETKPGVFDDGPEPDVKLWGVYGVTPLAGVRGANVDLYYLGLERKDAEFDQGVARELRHSIGTRLWGKWRQFDYNFELVYQFGTFGKGDIHAWTAASDQGYTFEKLPWRPRVGFKADITSGDNNPNDRDLETFNPLFPRGAYFSETGLIGPANHIDLHPSLELNPTKQLTLTLDWDFFWRESKRDGIYGNGVNLVVPAGSSSSGYVGNQVQVLGEWRIQRHLTLTAAYAHFFTGSFLDESTPGKDVDYVSTWLAFKF